MLESRGSREHQSASRVSGRFGRHRVPAVPQFGTAKWLAAVVRSLRETAAELRQWQPTAITFADRLAAVDVMRGLAILLMAVGNFEMGIEWMPAPLRHAPDVGYTIADLVAPMFITSIAFTIRSSMRRRQHRSGTRAALVHLLKRGLALIGIGSVISVGQTLLYPQPGIAGNWGVLQAIGAATVVAAPLVPLGTAARLLAATILLGGYQLLLDAFWLGDVLHTSHNGIWGSLSWAGMLLVGTAIADVFEQRKGLRRQSTWLAASATLTVAAGLVLSLAAPISKNRASASYMLLSLGMCVALLGICQVGTSRWPTRLRLLQAVGRNPLVLYIVNLLVLAVFTLPPVEGWHANSPLWLGLVQAGFILWVNFKVALALDARGWILRL